MNIAIETVPRDQMRYATDGDWFDRDGVLVIRVPDDLPADEAWLIALHEMVESKLCEKAGVTEARVDAFDFAFQDAGEPGDHPHAPYRIQHRQAMMVEHMAALFLGLDAYGVVA